MSDEHNNEHTTRLTPICSGWDLLRDMVKFYGKDEVIQAVERIQEQLKEESN